jgi:predicted SnoaL-like aldol condensation-catalyzing enzyme
MKFFLLSLAMILVALTSCSNPSLKTSTDPFANKVLVQNFYQMAFNEHKPKEAAEAFLSENYKQHNPYVGDGRQPFIDYFVPYFKKNSQSKVFIKRVVSEDDLVVVHAHYLQNEKYTGRAVVDIFRVQNGKIVEHWDVVQPVPKKAANNNTMF